ncbi:GAP1-N2 domain-containing protein [Paenibacillus sp. FSL K6-2393]|uniref:GAP1-N2 domain-containing protein n=1 Tax=Paenibacillus sp. FSL K6-2393 TaxID=2921475 RepID=UPI0030FC88D1
MMRSSVTPPIEQQLYTRERRGVFRTTEGFDTVAASPGLDPSFIKKVLHPYCVYDAPAELTGRSEKDETKFPASIHLLHLESGETILGQNVYQSADFTGLRSAFFAHNYVLSPERSEEQMKQGGWLDAVFATSYDIEQGTVLPALAELPISPGSGPDSSPTQVLSALKMNEVLFKRLLYAVMQSVATRRKVYIALDLPAEEVTAGAKGLLRLLYTALPYAFRRQLGFMTFAKEPQAKKGIHVQFVERGTLRPKDRNTEKDFTFDLVSGRVTHADASVAKLPYAEFAWALLQEPRAADAFYTFADEMLSGMEPGRELSIEAYGELAVFYGLEQGMEDLYLDSKSHVLSGLLTYLKPDGGSQQRSRLNELFLTLLSRELDSVKRENVPEEDVAARIGEYFSVAAPVVQSRIVDYFIYGVNNARAQKRMRAVQELYAVLDRDPQLNRAFFDKVLANESLTKLLFEPYLDNQLKRTESAANVVEVIRRWVTSHPSAIHYSFLQERTANELRERLCSAPNPVQSANGALQRVSILDRVSADVTYDIGITARIGQSEATARPNRKGGSPSASQDSAYQEELTRLADKLAYVINLFMIQDLDLDRVNREQLLSIDILQHGNEVRDWAARQGSDVSARTNMMLAARAWLSGEGNEEEALEALSLAERNELQRWTRRWLAGELQAHPGIAAYEALPMAFYRGGSGSNRLDYPGLIEFIRTNASRAEGLYPFFEWSGDHRMFVRGSNAHKGYADAIVAYFKAHDREAFKSKSAFKPYYVRASKTMKPVYDRAKTELSSPLVRMLTGKRKNLFGLLLLILVLGIAGGTYAWMKNSVEPPAASPPSTQDPAIPAEPEVQLAEQIAYMIPASEQEGTQSPAQLVIRFRNDTGSTEFEQGKLQLTMKDGSTQELDTTGKWESFNRNEEPDNQVPSDSSSGSTSEGSTDGASAGNAGNVEQTEDGDQQVDLSTSGDSTSDPATDTTTDTTGTNESSNAASGDTDQGTDADQATGSTSPDTSVSNEQDADATTSSQMSIGEVDRLYPYGLQIDLPADIDAENIASVQSTQGGMTVIQLMPQPKL